MAEKKVETIQRTGYVSEIDQFLRDYDVKHPSFGDSRQKEIQKHQRIFAKRDAAVEEEASSIWKEF
ncbi:MAG: CBU_0585 family protein [Candidatus Berkiella sp.]